MTPEVFVSYAHKDQEKVQPLVQQLQAAGVSVWIDESGIAGATLWSHEIVEAIEECRLFLLMLSEAAAASEQVVREVHLAAEARKPILPLLLEPVTIPRGMRYPLAGIQHIELFRGEREAKFHSVLRALTRLGVQVGEPEEPEAPKGVVHHLPHHLTSFVGREQEVAEVRRLLGSTRLLTITGPGGTGKSRLAVQVASELLPEFPDGVYFVTLASTGDPTLVVSTIAHALGVLEEGSRPPLESLKEQLREKQVLLLLDNFEQVLDAAPVVAGLLAACPRLKTMVTSREVLRMGGESEFPLAPLEVPEAKRVRSARTAAASPAVALFVERATAVKPDFELTNENARTVVEICTRLDGLPLAIELAAARVKMLPPQAMLARLENRLKLLTSGARDVPERHRTLRGAIDWSYDLLSPEEQALFRRLPVFAGGWSLETAEEVGNAVGELPIDVLDGLASLVDKSLVQRDETAEDETRFSMLGTIREYGLERLAESGELEDTQRAHAAYYLALAQEAEPRLRGKDQATWLHRLETEHDNLRAAMDWAVSAGEVETALRFPAALWRFWHVRAYLREGRDRIEAALAMPAAAARTCDRARALNGAGALAHDQGDYQQSAVQHEESLEIARECGDRETMATALNNLGNVALDQGDDDAANAFYQEALALWRDLGNKQGIAMVGHNLGSVARDRGEYREATTYFEESLALKRQLGDQRGIASSLNNLGLVLVSQESYERAASLLNESLRLFQQLDDSFGIAMALKNLADLVSAQGNLVRAAALHRECLHHCQKLENRPAIALSLEGLAGVVGAQGHALPAAHLFGAAEALREQAGAPLADSARATYEEKVAAARAHVDASRWQAAWAEGRAMDLDAVIAFAVGDEDAAHPQMVGAEA